MTYTVVLRREPEGGYALFVPALPGCLTHGGTVQEALDMAREVIPAFVEVLREEGKPIPSDQPDVRLGMRQLSEALVDRLTIEEGRTTIDPDAIESRLDQSLGKEAKAILADPDTEWVPLR